MWTARWRSAWGELQRVEGEVISTRSLLSENGCQTRWVKKKKDSGSGKWVSEWVSFSSKGSWSAALSDPLSNKGDTQQAHSSNGRVKHTTAIQHHLVDEEMDDIEPGQIKVISNKWQLNPNQNQSTHRSTHLLPHGADGGDLPVNGTTMSKSIQNLKADLIQRRKPKMKWENLLL